MKEQSGRRHSGDVEEPEEQKVSTRTSNRDSTVQHLSQTLIYKLVKQPDRSDFKSERVLPDL